MPWYVKSAVGPGRGAGSSVDPLVSHLLVGVATLAVSFFLGGYLSKKLRMPDHGWKIGVCLFSVLASVVVLLMDRR